MRGGGGGTEVQNGYPLPNGAIHSFFIKKKEREHQPSGLIGVVSYDLFSLLL